jgi:hypothetical protein
MILFPLLQGTALYLLFKFLFKTWKLYIKACPFVLVFENAKIIIPKEVWHNKILERDI